MLPLSGIVYFVFAIVVVPLEFAGADWVEIPFLQPSTTTQKTTVIRKNSNQTALIANSNIISHVLPAVGGVRPILTEAELESSVKVPNSDNQHKLYLRPFQNPVTPVRISNLVDFDEFTRRSSTEITRGEKVTTAEPNVNFQKWFSEHKRANISAVLPWSSLSQDRHSFVTTANRTEHPPIAGEDRLPLSNKYEEESIEYLNRDDVAPHRGAHAVPTQNQPVNQRLDFSADDYASEETEQNNSAESAESQDDADQFADFDDYDQQFQNASNFKRRRRPFNRGRVTIVRVIPPRRRFRPKEANGDGSFVGFLRFLKRMQDGFMLKTAKSLGDKIKLLTNLKDQLLLNIESRMSALWGRAPSFTGVESSGNQRRIKRGWMEAYSNGGHGGIGFASTETTLLTLSFLTFAVFLIKLVLQVINTIKSKHYMYTMTSLNRPTIKLKRSKRSREEEDLLNRKLNIMSAINSYKFN
ncbi:uncharacterized protein LOC129729743 [Wyeomyia smithii]|uniref:uncharacterized protein LOC129729743 n=1 Tax=Wyeomyia smithii TaxID=174621 RepID=UPI002467BC9E|nr:uncharacterized protein LOC129729743 [Wyeomyia smithii]